MEVWHGYFELALDRGGKILIGAGALEAMASQFVPDKETGGIILGRIRSEDSAPMIVKCLPAPLDSRSTRWTFERGFQGLAETLQAEFEAGYSYLGEWHTHPGAGCRPSVVDLTTMSSIAKSKAYLPERPLMIIVGGVQGRNRVVVYRYRKLFRPSRTDEFVIPDVLALIGA